jgi:hypothetical protein
VQVPGSSSPPSSSPSTSPAATPGPSGAPGDFPSGDTAVVAAHEGVLGWFDGDNWVQAQTSAPIDGDETFQVFRLGSAPATARGAGLDRGCPVFEEGIGVRLEPSPWPEFDPFSPSGIAVTAGWDASPHAVEALPVTEAYRGIATELLVTRGIDDDAPEFAQLVRADIDGNGVAEVFGVVERRTGQGDALTPAPAGDYSIAFARVVSGEDVETTVLGEWVVVEHEDPDVIQDLVVFRIDALADADGDGVDEVAVRSSYYEGSGIQLFDWQGPDGGFVEVVSAGCGA